MNVYKKILSLRGREMLMSYPTKEDADLLPLDDEGEPDLNKLPKETVGNVIINSLTTYASQDKRDGFKINAIASSIMAATPENPIIEFKDKYVTFLKDVLRQATIREEDDEKGKKKKTNSPYAAWSIAQVLMELGEEPEEEVTTGPPEPTTTTTTTTTKKTKSEG